MTPHDQANHGMTAERLVIIRHIEAMTGLNSLSELDEGEADRVSTYECD